MRKRNYNRIPALALALALLAGCAPAAEPAPAPEITETVVLSVPTPTAEPEPTLALRSDKGHPALMELRPDGCFHPNAPVTKLEFCQLLFPRLEGLEKGRVAFSDFRPGSEGYRTVASLYAAGLLPDEAGESFGADRAVKRVYVVEVLERAAAAMDAEDAARVKTLAAEMKAGQTAPEGVELHEGSFLTRGELAVVLERLTGREPNGNDLFLNGCFPPDLRTQSELAACIADAVTEGEVSPVPGGVHRLYGWLYAAWDDGTMVTDMDYGVWTFGSDGRYTTGSEALDAYVAEALAACGADGIEDDTEALKAAYLYIKYHYTYLVRPEDMQTIPVGETGWESERAERFFRYGGGTCYGWAAALCELARALGFHAYAVAAEVNQFYGDHGFVVIPEGDVDYIYDVEMEATRLERHKDLELFHIVNYSIYNYWYISNWREE